MHTARGAEVAPSHPLDPLTAGEIDKAVEVLRAAGRLGREVLVVSICLDEPTKDAVLGFHEDQGLDRRAFIVLRNRGERCTYEAVVSITDRTIVSWQAIPRAQPPITIDEFFACERIVRGNEAWQAAMRRRGLTTLDLAIVDPWSAGYYDQRDDPTRRLIRALTWVRSDEGDNGYARPVEGLITLVDMDTMDVLEVEDHGVVPLPTRAGNYSPAALTDPGNFPYFPSGTRPSPRPLEIIQREGPSFTVHGWEVRWEKWRFRIGFTPREGLVLYTVGYEDAGHLRPVLYRASLSEMVVPYGDAGATHWRKNAFDEGEFGLGMLTNALELGCDCLGEIRYFDVVMSNTEGTPTTLQNAVCLHEEDFGLLWKHTNFRSGQVEVRRSRRLSVSSIATAGNYEYGFFWYLYQDGTIELEVKLTGIVSTGAVAPGAEPAYGAMVAPELYAPNHQHWFNVRLDMMVDGRRNSVYEANSEAVERGPGNPHGNAWIVRRQLLAHESEAQRQVDPLAGRYWVIVNPERRNSLGQLVGYRLVPGDNVRAFAHPDSSIARRAGFTSQHLWVTPHDPRERYAAGDYPNQHPGGAGLPTYVKADRALENSELVLWYSFGSHHVARPEDWPVMSVVRTGFCLKPDGFFDGNAALDVAPPVPHKTDHCPA